MKRKKNSSERSLFFSDVFIEGIKSSPQTLLLEYKIDLNDTSPLKSNPHNLGPILEEIAGRQIQEYMNVGFYVRSESKYMSPAFVVVMPKKADDPQVDNLKRLSMRWRNTSLLDSLLNFLSSITESYLIYILFLLLKKWLLELVRRTKSSRQCWILDLFSDL